MPGTLNELTVLRATVNLPRIGVWWADLVLDADEFLTGSASLVYDRWGLNGSLLDGGSPINGRLSIRMQGGAGKMGKVVPAKTYQGVPVRLPIVDTIKSVGEAVSPEASSGLDIVLPHWIRIERDASQCIALLAMKTGYSWRFLPDGTFWFGDETWPEVSIEFELMDEMPEQDAVLIATDDLLLPGTTFLGRQVGRVQMTPQESRSMVWFDA